MAKRKSYELPTLKKNKKGEYFINFSGKKIYIGRNPKLARERLVQFLAEGNTKGSVVPSVYVRKEERTTPTVAELILAYLEHLENIKYGNFDRAKVALRRTKEMFGDMGVRDFGPLAFREVRESWIRDGLAWTYINNLTQMVRQMFQFGLEFEMVDESTVGRLSLVKPLTKKDAKSNPPRMDVADDDILKTLPHLLPTVRDMVVLQRLTGMRPSEVFRMTMAQIDTTGDVWVYVPEEFKTEDYTGTDRVIALGKPEQEIIRRHATSKQPDEILFSPRDAVREQWKRDRPGKMPDVSRFHETYNKDSYRRSVQRAIDRANRQADAAAKPENRIPTWTPYQLRHASATFISLLFGREQAAIQLGHSSTATTRRYDHSAAKKAVELVKRRDAECKDIVEKFQHDSNPK